MTVWVVINMSVQSNPQIMMSGIAKPTTTTTSSRGRVAANMNMTDGNAASLSASSRDGSAQADAQGSNVRETFRLMGTLIYPAISLAYLDRCARILQRRHMETVFEERSVQSLCAFPPCANKLREKNAKFRVSLKKKEIYDATEENQFCSEQCRKKARVFVSRLVTKPPQLVPSLSDVFGTDKPNPFTWEKQQQELRAAAGGSSSLSSSAKRRMPSATTVWAKTSDLGVVERLVPEPTALASLAAKAPQITENTQPEAPTNEFPDASQAVLIEGFVFPSHKESLAKKVEKKWQKTAQTQDEIIVSDSEESDFGSSEEDNGDDESASSTSSLDLSDFDPEDLEEEEIISSDDLPLFINMWRMLSQWITHDTNLVVAHKPMEVKPSPPKPTNAQEKKQRDEADRAAQLQFTERYNAFALMLGRPLPLVSRQLSLPCDRYASSRIDAFVKSFSFRDAIDGRNSHVWTCITAVLLLVAHDKQVETMSPEQLSTALRVTKLDSHELAQLLALFYTLRDDSMIVVDDDVAARVSDSDAAERDAKRRAADAVKKCRKCWRPHTKCVCDARASQKTEETSDFSTDEVTQMFRDAVTLREHYEDLVDAAGGSYDDVD